MADDIPDSLLPFDPSMKKKKKKKKTAFDPDAVDGGDIVTDGAPTSDEPQSEDKVVTDEAAKDKPIDEDISLDFDGTKKKKKKKKQPFEFEEIKESLPETTDSAAGDGETADADSSAYDDTVLNLPDKKRRRKPRNVELETEDVEENTTVQEGKSWTGTDRDYSYDELLNRVFEIMREKNPEMIGEKKKIVMRPPQVLRAGARRTSFANFADISRMLHRQPKHVLAFLLAELGTSGSVDGNNQLIIRGKFNQKQIENVLRRYIKEYVTCHTCKSPDTLLQKEERLFFLQCETCGSRCSVASIKSGFQAVTGRRAAMRAK